MEPSTTPAAPPDPVRLTRRRFLVAAGVIAVGGVAAAALGPSARRVSPVAFDDADASSAAPSPTPSPLPHRGYRTRPDLQPPLLAITTREAALPPGFLFLTPANGAGTDGPTILDDAGELVWMFPDTSGNATDLKVASYRGQPVLVWWEGANNAGVGTGEHVIVDATYREIARIAGASGRMADLHELQLTARGTALFLAYASVDPTPGVGQVQPKPPVMDCAIQEVDIVTGRLLFEWHAVAHISVDESVAEAPTASGQAYDYLHANSIDEDTDGNLLVSARNTSAVYKVDRQTGEIRWRLGGKRSDFAMGPGTRFALQHDARRQPDGTLTLFDDGQAPGHSRAIVLRLDETAMTATLVREYPQPEGMLSTSQGNMQVLPDGHVFVGWGSVPRLSEFDAAGRLLFDATFTATQSYRDFRFPWSARPADPPTVVVDATAGALTVYASWNGATDVAVWEVLAGPSSASLSVVTSVPRAGFETVIDTPASGPFVVVRALDANGRVLGTSPIVSAPS